MTSADQAFDLEYRPVRFADVLGNAGVVRLLLKWSQDGNLSARSMMFGGPKGSGKTSLARIVARAIVCDDLRAGEPCNDCHGCRSIRDESADSVEEFDAATQGTIERMRSIIEGLEYGTVSGKPRVVVLDEAHRLSKASQDALLKAMEDRRLTAILCTTEPHAIKTAIRSRVDEFPVSYPSEQELVARLDKVCKDKGLMPEPEALDLIVKLNGRCPRTSLVDLWRASKLGGVSVENVKQITRFASMEAVVRALSFLPIDPRAAVAEFDRLFDQEGPTWVRDQVVLAISSAMRASFGAKSTYPVPSGFWESRGRAWLSIAHALSVIDRPNQADIEAVLYMDVVPAAPYAKDIVAPPVPAALSSPPPAQQPAPVKVEPSRPSEESPKAVSAAPSAEEPKPAPRPRAPKETLTVPTAQRKVEIDGVVFTSDEELTSLDKKIEHGTSGPDSPPQPDIRVEYDPESKPMTEKEFARGFLERIRS